MSRKKKSEEHELLKKELEDFKDILLRRDKELEDLKDDNLRLRADFENYRKQLDKEKEQFAGLANEGLIKDLLNIVDDLERAAEMGEEGIGLIHKNFFKVLESNGLRRIECIGEKFDPYYHEVMCQEESDKEEGTVLEELQPGYILKDKVIRHSKVKIAK